MSAMLAANKMAPPAGSPQSMAARKTAQGRQISGSVTARNLNSSRNVVTPNGGNALEKSRNVGEISMESTRNFAGNSVGNSDTAGKAVRKITGKSAQTLASEVISKMQKAENIPDIPKIPRIPQTIGKGTIQDPARLVKHLLQMGIAIEGLKEKFKNLEQQTTTHEDALKLAKFYHDHSITDRGSLLCDLKQELFTENSIPASFRILSTPEGDKIIRDAMKRFTEEYKLLPFYNGKEGHAEWIPWVARFEETLKKHRVNQFVPQRIRNDAGEMLYMDQWSDFLFLKLEGVALSDARAFLKQYEINDHINVNYYNFRDFLSSKWVNSISLNALKMQLKTPRMEHESYRAMILKIEEIATLLGDRLTEQDKIDILLGKLSQDREILWKILEN